jgi:DNA-binding CsgD family transcriptional regulator
MMAPASVSAGSLEPQALAGCIDALGSAHFTSHLTKLLRSLVGFECSVIVGYRPGKHPIYLYDSLQHQRELLFQRYLLHAYQHDPFLVRLAERQEEGVFQIGQAQPVRKEDQRYLEDFYQQTGWRDELCLTLRLTESRWIVVYLGMLQDQARFSDGHRDTLMRYLDVFTALCRQHWGQAPLHLSPLPLESNIGQQLRQSVASFGQTLLTEREQQVAALMVQGLDSQEIAEHLRIGHGTVKNHRKRIYAGLGVNSLSELFGLFLNYTVAVGTPPADD